MWRAEGKTSGKCTFQVHFPLAATGKIVCKIERKTVALVGRAGEPLAVYLFFGSYDVPTKGKDKENQWESEEVYQFLIGTISPVTGDYEAGKPEAGFLYPAFANHSTDIDGINIYQAEEGAQLFAKILGVQA